MAETIFLSSTFVDLEEHRRLIREAIARLEYQSKAMEIFGALPNTPKEECLRLVRESDVYIGIFGMRYGSIDIETEKSLTQLEYEEAVASTIPCLIYLIDENLHPVYPKFVETGPSALKLANFKDHLRKKHVVNTFSSPHDLAEKLTRDLVRLIRARVSQPTALGLAHIAKNITIRHPLTEERYQFLKGKIAKFFSSVPPDAILREALELTLAGDRLAAGFVLSRGGEISLDESIDALMEFDKLMQEILENNDAQKTKVK